MCDCYAETCEEDGCNVRIGVHIGDFKYPRSTVRVRCNAHPPKEEGWFVWHNWVDEGRKLGDIYLACSACDDPVEERVEPNEECEDPGEPYNHLT